MKQSYMGGIYLTLAASIWGGMYVVSKYALDTIPPFTLMFIRYVLAFTLLAILSWHENRKIVPVGSRRLLFQIGFIGYFLSIAAQFVGTKLSSAHMGAVITTLSPVFLSLFAVRILKEKMSKQQGRSMTIALVGVLVILNPWGSNIESGSNTVGKLILLLAAVFWGYYSVLVRKASRIYSPLQITTYGIFIAAVIDIPFVIMEVGKWSVQAIFMPPIIGSVLYIALISTALAFYCWNKGLSMLPAHQAGPFFFFQPLVGTLLSWAILNEQITGLFFIGGLLIIAGVYLGMIERKE